MDMPFEALLDLGTKSRRQNDSEFIETALTDRGARHDRQLLHIGRLCR